MPQSNEVRYTARSITPPADRDSSSKSPPPKRRAASRSPPLPPPPPLPKGTHIIARSSPCKRRSVSRSPPPRRRSVSRSPPPKRRGRSRSRSRSRNRSRSRSGDEVRNPGNNLYVTGLSTRTSGDDLEKFFSKEGKVKDCHVVMDPRTKESRGFAFVTMDNIEDARRCIKYLHRTVLEGRLISVAKVVEQCLRVTTVDLVSNFQYVLRYCGKKNSQEDPYSWRILWPKRWAFSRASTEPFTSPFSQTVKGSIEVARRKKGQKWEA